MQSSDSDSENAARHDEVCIIAPNQEITLLRSVLALQTLFDFSLFGTPPEDEPTTTLKPVRTLKVVLAAGSKYFHRLFTNYSKDSQTNEHTSDVFSHECITSLVKLLHTGKVHAKSFEFAIELFEAVQFYAMDNLVSACEAYFTSNLHVDNCVDLWKVACKYKSSSVSNAECEEFITMNLSTIMTECNSFLALQEDEICKLLLAKAIVSSASADIRLRFALAWLEFDPINRQGSSEAVLNSISFVCPGPISQEVLANAYRSEALSHTAKDKLLKLSACHSKLDIRVPTATYPGSSSEIENLYFVGGFDEEYYKQFLQYNVDRKEWIPLDPLPWDRNDCAAGVCNDDRLLVFGGEKNGKGSADVDEFNLSNSTWTPNKVATLPRSTEWKACGNEQTVYLSNELGEFITYSPQTKQIVTKKAMPCKRFRHSASYSAALNSVFIADGYRLTEAVTQCYCPRIDKYDIANNTWQSVGCAKIKCSQRASALCGDELYLIGGHDGSVRLKTAEVCNVLTGKTWAIPDLLDECNDCRAALLYNNVICVFANWKTSVDTYDVREGKWTADGTIVPDMPVAYGDFALAWK